MFFLQRKKVVLKFDCNLHDFLQSADHRHPSDTV
jgi:hypothetical protein